MKRKLEFDKLQTKIQNKNIPFKKLATSQLKALLMHKKPYYEDKIKIAKLKQPGLFALWLE